VNNYTKDMDSKIMGINNDIAIKQKELEVSKNSLRPSLGYRRREEPTSE
jgi:hypothetical protein